MLSSRSDHYREVGVNKDRLSIDAIHHPKPQSRLTSHGSGQAHMDLKNFPHKKLCIHYCPITVEKTVNGGFTETH